MSSEKKILDEKSRLRAEVSFMFDTTSTYANSTSHYNLESFYHKASNATISSPSINRTYSLANSDERSQFISDVESLDSLYVVEAVLPASSFKSIGVNYTLIAPSDIRVPLREASFRGLYFASCDYLGNSHRSRILPYDPYPMRIEVFVKDSFPFICILNTVNYRSDLNTYSDNPFSAGYSPFSLSELVDVRCATNSSIGTMDFRVGDALSTALPDAAEYIVVNGDSTADLNAANNIDRLGQSTSSYILKVSAELTFIHRTPVPYPSGANMSGPRVTMGGLGDFKDCRNGGPQPVIIYDETGDTILSTGHTIQQSSFLGTIDMILVRTSSQIEEFSYGAVLVSKADAIAFLSKMLWGSSQDSYPFEINLAEWCATVETCIQYVPLD